MKTRSILCASHFLKNLIIKAKKITDSKKVRKCFVFMFTLIQNSRTIEELSQNLEHVFIIFNKKTFDEKVRVSLQKMRLILLFPYQNHHLFL